MGNPLNYNNGSSYTFTWKNGRELATLSTGTTSVTYNYNADSVRIKKTVNGVVHEYVVDGYKILEEKYGTTVLKFTYDENDAPQSISVNGTVYYYGKNLQGDIVKIYDSNGNSVAGYSYDAWGNILSITYTSIYGASVSILNPFRYRGYYYDTESGLYYLNSRYYDAKVERFINADDPEFLGATGTNLSYNTFLYCDNSPISLIDYTGNAPYLGWGIQLEGSFMGIIVGIELIWYDSIAKPYYGNRKLPCIYIYGGFGINVKSGNIWNIKSLITFVKDESLRAFGSASKAAWKIGGGLSICAFRVYGIIKTPYDYKGPFISIGATLWHIKAYYSQSPSRDVFSVGIGISSSKFGFSPLSGTYYTLIPFNWVITIADMFSSLFGRMKTISNMA